MIPLATTTVSVLRATVDASRDDMDAPADSTYSVVASGVRAVISSPSGQTASGNGTREEITFRLGCDPIPVGLSYLDHVRDEQTGQTFFVIWAQARTGLGIDHIEGGLRQVVGEN